MALIKLRDYVQEKGIEELAIPRLSCNNDGLKWVWQKQNLQRVFWDTKVTLHVYHKKGLGRYRRQQIQQGESGGEQAPYKLTVRRSDRATKAPDRLGHF